MISQNISFSVPNISSLKKQGYTCVDMHFHTVNSDGAATVDEILEKSRKLKIGFSITDHNEIKGCLDAIKKKKGTDFIIPGIEVKSKELVDILFYFYNLNDLKQFYTKEILPYRKKISVISRTTVPLKNLHNLSTKYNCVTSVAHPYGYSMRVGVKNLFKKHEQILKKFDIIEALNGGNSRTKNEYAVEYIRKHKKGFTAGSDGHSIYALGNVVTCSKAKNVKEFLDNIKNKKNKIIGIEDKFGKFSTYGNYIKNKIKNLITK